MRHSLTSKDLDVRMMPCRYPAGWIQYRYLIHAPVNWTSASAWLYKHPWTTSQNNYRPSTSMTHVACDSKLRLVVRSSMHPCPGNCMAIRCVVVYYARATRTFSAGIKCQHCRCPYLEYWSHDQQEEIKLNTNLKQINSSRNPLRDMPLWLVHTYLNESLGLQKTIPRSPCHSRDQSLSNPFSVGVYPWSYNLHHI